MYIIYDGTPFCDKHCMICATSAIYIDPALYHKVHSSFVDLGLDLPLEEKKKIIQWLSEMESEFDTKIEIGNGNLLISNDGLELIKEASKVFGRENVSISISGSLLTEKKASIVAKNASKVIVSMDFPPGTPDKTRYKGIAKDATTAMDIFRKRDVEVSVSTILKRNNANSYILSMVLQHIIRHDATEWELLRYYPVGRAFKMSQLEPTLNQYLDVLRFVRSARQTYAQEIGIRFQHSLAYLLEGVAENCQAVTNQIAVRSNGLVVACPWSHDIEGNALSPLFVLGKLPEMTVGEILESPPALFWKKIKSRGPCRLAAFLHHVKSGVSPEIALQRSDPLEISIKRMCIKSLPRIGGEY